MFLSRLSFILVLSLASCQQPESVLADKQLASAATSVAKLDYNRDVQPILSEYCYHCHGPDTGSRKAKLRLDLRSEALAHVCDSNKKVIVPGKPEVSELVSRVECTDPDEIMPQDPDKRLKPPQIKLLRRWIAEGAEFRDHWAFEAPVKVAPPLAKTAAWPRNEIDRFVLARLEQEGLKPSAEEVRGELLRRLTLDLTGLLPSPEELNAFRADTSPQAYEKAVDRLLASPRFGEHRAHYWLDYARYGDSHGLHNDMPRSIWPWRDYVVKSFNVDIPFDRFVLEQLAGDLLPERSVDSLIATGLVRNGISTGEGGAFPQELRCSNKRERSEAFGTLFLGLSTGCAVCHDHKYDPITQKDFYSLTAFFNNLDEDPSNGDRADWPPFIHVPPEKNRAAVEALLKRQDQLRRENAIQAEIDKLQKEIETLSAAGPVTLVCQEKPGGVPAAEILDRGVFTAPGEKVGANTPGCLPPMPATAPRNRLGLAQWLVLPEHPLLARVTVNRVWQELFGTGLVETAEDFGVIGARPSHQELLDWLAVDFRDHGWQLKRVYKMLVMSAAYRQSSAISSAALAKDPGNRLISRGPRYRLDAEVLRDCALQSSGLLVEKLGGPGVKPYQPTGIWEACFHPALPNTVYQQDHGEALYRRSLYSFLRRKAPLPNLDAFDLPDRGIACSRRQRSNSPLAALVMLNDPQFLEAARQLGRRCLEQAGDDATRLNFLCRVLLSRDADATTRAILAKSLASLRSEFQRDPAAAAQLLKVGESATSTSLPAPEQAAWMMLASTLMNSDAFLNK